MRCRDLISSSDFERTDTLSFAKKAAQAPSVQNRLVDQRRNVRQRIPRVKRTRRFQAGGQINADRVLGTPYAFEEHVWGRELSEEQSRPQSEGANNESSEAC